MTKSKTSRDVKADPHDEKSSKKGVDGINLIRSAELRREIRKSRKRGRYATLVFTAAQNATPIHSQFHGAIKSLLKHRDAKLYVIPIRYKNPTSHWSQTAKSHDWWAPEIEDYILAERTMINRNLVVLADIRTQPTADSPLSGFDAISRDMSAIIGHTKIEMKTVPTPQNKMPKILLTTGAITKANFTPTKAGKIGEFHHTLGATIVEVVGGKFFMRQIYATGDGSFIDVNYEYSADKPPRKVARAKALVLGDDQFPFIADNVVKATYGEGGIVEVLKPEYLVRHDGHDFHPRSHHNRKDPVKMGALFDSKKDSIDRELNAYAEHVDLFTPPDTVNVFVPSNHTTEHMTRWIKETDPKSDPANDIFWCDTYKAMRLGAKVTNKGVEEIDPFAYWMEKKLKKAKAIFLKVGEPFIKLGVDMGFHGDKGANGSRGSLRTYRNIGARTMIGHSHCPGIKDGAFQVGMSSEYNLPYEQGSPSGRLQAHGVLYENGKRAIIIIVEDGWRAEGFKPKRKSSSKSER